MVKIPQHFCDACHGYMRAVKIGNDYELRCPDCEEKEEIERNRDK